MKIVRVQYTTTQEYAATNQENIRKITDELRKLNHPGIKYAAYLLPDGKTFMHFDQFENEEAHQFLTELESFKKFSTELWASGLEVEPKLELPQLVAASFDFFG
jgi:quinol monooxygenase YgiN